MTEVDADVLKERVYQMIKDSLEKHQNR
jgi:hypothetical protein